MDLQCKKVFNPPKNVNIDGIYLFTDTYEVVFKRRVDETRLSSQDEVLIATYPRTGTTWISQIISLLIGGDGNFEELKSKQLDSRVPYLEMHKNGIANIDNLASFSKPRAEKTHLPYRFIKRWIEEDKVKTIITTRHPKDTLVSLFHFYKSMKRSWDDFFQHFIAGYIHYGDQLAWYQDFAQNVNQKHDVLYIRYEDMKENIEKEVWKIISFLNLNTTTEFVKKVLNVSSVGHMSEDKATNKQEMTDRLTPGGTFIRKGACGDWKKYFTVAQNEWFDSVYKEGYNNCSINIAYD